MQVGTRIGDYEVVATLGEGGMGQVFRARDRVLHRDVAIKVLPPQFAQDADRRLRFSREARALAALNHPNIAQIYGVEASNGDLAIVMELVPGETLRDVIANRSLPARVAIDYARQIALALDAAHDKNIVHRDLKPSNVTITPDGIAKVLDFGIAKVWTDSGGGDAVETAVADPTRAGEAIGTVGYMSPEQLRGQPVDRRADIWAFGCVLFELFAGSAPFAAGSLSDGIAAVLDREPDWARLPASTPPRIRHLITRCLEKDRRQRLRDIGDALPDLAEGSPTGSMAAAAGAPPRAGSTTPVLAALAALVVVLAATSLWLWSERRDPSPPTDHGRALVRFTVPPPAGVRYGSLLPWLETTTIAFAPDGQRLAFVAIGSDGTSRLWLRALDAADAHPVSGTEQATSVFWSPDGRSLGFFAAGKLKRIGVEGGTAVTLCDVPTGAGLAGTWRSSGDILFASVQGNGIFRVPASGGTPEELVATSPERRVLWPHALPDGQRFLYSWAGPQQTGGIVLVDAGGEHRPLVAARSLAQFVAPDLLLTVRDATLLAQRVDLAAARMLGDPLPLGRVAYSSATGWAEFSASPGGMLALSSHIDESALTLVTRDGRAEREIGARGQYNGVRSAPDGSELLFSRWRLEPGTFAVWRMRLDREAETLLTASPGMETAQVWVPGMREIVLTSATDQVPNIVLRDLGTGQDRRLSRSPRFQLANDVSPDRVLVFQQRTPEGNYDLMQMPLDAPERVAPLMATRFSEANLRFSPDGRRISFMSDESGRTEVYVAPFPFTGRKTQVSSGGGLFGRWRPDGRELFFLSSRGQLMAVAVDPSGNPGTPKALFETSRWLDFDVLSDTRFIANIAKTVASEQPLSILLNWPRLLERSVP